ncbi:ashwin [Anguilla rostrata]|uniref:ashwin n=1 Tax=Anguilla rostrata TaxID=7938 RepID=UPI0030D5E50E
MADYSTGRQGKDRSTRNDASNTDLLLHPELLSRDFIQLVLHERKIGAGEHSEASQDRLTDLYLQHVIPLPQRDLPDSRWGRRVGRNRPRPSPGHAHRGTHSSGGENTRKRPLIVFDGSSTRTGSVKLKKPEPGSGTDRLKPPPSGNLANPIRKLCGPPSSPAGTPVSPPGGTNRSPAGNGRTGSPTSPPPAVATATVATATVAATAVATAAVRVKRQAAQERECDSSGELRSPEAKKKIQHVTWP